MIELTLIGKPDCHLCEDARAVVQDVLAEFDSASFALAELSILDDPQLHEQYVEEIPVLLIDGKVHNIWRVDPARLRSALQGRVT
jgi:predicted thioredoxin/glutaredoxin